MKTGFVSRDGPVAALVGLATGYQAAQALCTAIELGLFDVLGGRALSAASLARKLDVAEDVLERLLRVLEALSLIERRGNSLRNTPVARRHLCAGSPESMVPVILHNRSLADQWAGLQDALVRGTMAAPSAERLAAYPRQLKLFLHAMDALGRIKCRQIEKKLDMSRCRSMLDVGGGLGTYAVCFARAHRGLRATVYDLKPVAVHARTSIRRARMQSRIRVLAGECLHEPLPAGSYDLVLISNLLHVYGREECRTIVGKAVAVLAPRGILLIHDYFVGRGDRLAAALFDLTMLVGTPRGRCHRCSDAVAWMRSAGVVQIKTADIGAGTSIVWGTKKT